MSVHCSCSSLQVEPEDRKNNRKKEKSFFLTTSGIYLLRVFCLVFFFLFLSSNFLHFLEIVTAIGIKKHNPFISLFLGTLCVNQQVIPSSFLHVEPSDQPNKTIAEKVPEHTQVLKHCKYIQ